MQHRHESSAIPIFSLDVAGIVPSVPTAHKVYGKTPLLLEYGVLNTRPVNEILQEAVAAGDRIIGLHGRHGPLPKDKRQTPLSSLITRSLLHIVPETHVVVHLAQEIGAEYVVIHTPEARHLQSMQAVAEVVRHFLVPAILYIENIPGDTIQDVLQLVQALREANIPAEPLVDIAHSMVSRPKFVDLVAKTSFSGRDLSGKRTQVARQTFAEVLEEVEQAMATPNLHFGFHLPIGTRADDSIPVEELTIADWTQLAELFDRHTYQVSHRIIENQTGVLGYFGKHTDLEISRHQAVLQLLYAAGVVSPHA